MRTLIVGISISLLIGCATTLPPASANKKMMDRADKIYLTTEEDPDKTYKGFANYLSSNDFSFDNSDEVINVLKTDFKQSNSNRRYKYSLNVNIRKDSLTVIQISGTVLNDYLGESDIENKGMSGSIMKDAWMDIKEMAENYPHKDIYYGRN